MADDEMLKFEITDQDLENEFRTGFRRRGLTKEQQIYGMWAENSDAEDDDGSSSRPSFGGTKFLNKGGVSFVAGGVQQAGKKKEKNELEEDEEDLEEMPRPMFGNQIGSSDEEEDHLPLDFGRRRNLGSSSKSAKMDRSRDLAGFRRAAPVYKEGGIGDWEKHTTGIGSKLMKMMGYEEGKGLGKNLQGISTPVEANKRKGKGAIGFYGTERTEKSLKDFPVQDSDEEEKTKFEEQLQQWKKGKSKKKVKYVYKSAEEVVQEGKTKKLKAKPDNITKTKVIDMTGPETRVLSSYHAIGGQQQKTSVAVDEMFEEAKKKKFEHFDLPELIHNVEILLEKSEDDILRNAKTLEREENRIVHLNHEREKYELLLDQEVAELKTMEGAMAMMESLESQHSEKCLTLHDAATIFRKLKESHWKMYTHFELAYLAPTYVTPLLKQAFSKWNPLADPTQHLEIMASWRELLEGENPSFGTDDMPMDPNYQIVWDSWTLCIRCAIDVSWEPKDSAPLVNLLEIWVPPLIPTQIHAHILQHVVLPRITKAVNEWNPMEDTVAIHTWIHPWLPLLSNQLQVVYPVIRQKLSSALTLWHPSDQSAKMVLQPWKDVFSEVSMTNLLQTSIQPKIESALMEMAIAPHNQKLEAWNWFTLWDDLFSSQIILDILERCFFHRWYQALGAWLSNNPPYQEVISWYKGWRDSMPKKVVCYPQVKQKLQQYLEICRRAFAYQPAAIEQITILLTGLDNLLDAVPPPPPPPPTNSPPRRKDWENIISNARRENLSMKEVVERRCQDREILFYPVPDKSHEGRPVYRCGLLIISFHKNLIYVQTERGWVPKSLTTVLDDAS